MFRFVISRNGLLVAGGRAVETSPIFVFRMTFYVHRGSGQARLYPRRSLSLSSRAKAFTLKGRHRRFVGDSSFHTSLRCEQQKWYQQILQKVQNLVPHDYIKSCTVHTVVQQYVLVDCCCFHLTSGASTAVGSYIIPRNRKRFFLLQSTLREEFVETKYQVFHIVGPLIILVQVDLSSPVERVSKSWNFRVSKPQHRCGVCLKFCTYVVYKND